MKMGPWNVEMGCGKKLTVVERKVQANRLGGRIYLTGHFKKKKLETIGSCSDFQQLIDL